LPGNGDPRVRIEVDHADSPFGLGQSTDDRQLGFLIAEVVRPPADLSLPLDLSDPRIAGALLQEGWYDAASDGTWATAGPSRLILPTALLGRGPKRLRFDLTPAPTGAKRPVAITATVSGRSAARWTFASATPPSTVLTVDPSRDATADGVSIQFSTANAISPAEAGLSSDPRILGFLLHSIRVADDNEASGLVRGLFFSKGQG
jgi:hypothetical protein